MEAGCRNSSKSSKMDVRGVGADGNMTEIMLGLFVMEHDEGILDDEDLLLLSVALEVGDSRGFLTIPLEIPARPDLFVLGDKEFLIRYRFTRRQVCWVHTALDFPPSFSAPCRTTWSSMEGLLILLRRLTFPARLSELCTEFGRSTSSLSKISNIMLAWVWSRWGQLLTNPFGQPFFSADRVTGYGEAIARKMNVDLPVWGFIDGTVRPICRPERHQRQFYNGHKRTHAIKFQAVAAPDGLIVHLYGPVEGHRHDAGVLAESGLPQQLAAHMNSPTGMPYAVYGDPAYPLSPYIQKAYQSAARTPNQRRYNTSMNGARVSVEWAFGDIASWWKFVGAKKQQKMLLQPVALYYQVATLLTNLRTIVRYGNSTSKHFDISPPSLVEYLQ